MGKVLENYFGGFCGVGFCEERQFVQFNNDCDDDYDDYVTADIHDYTANDHAYDDSLFK